MLYRLNLILNSNHGLTLFRQNQIRSSTNNKNLQKHNSEDFFLQLLNAWLSLNLDSKLVFSSDNPYFYCIPPKNLSPINLLET